MLESPLETPESQDSEEFVPETQPEPSSGKGKNTRSHKKKSANVAVRSRPERWTPEEEYGLANAWHVTSEDPIHSNNRTGPEFWRDVRKKFRENVDHQERRNEDMISSKWGDMSKKIKKFNGIVQQKKASRRSGQSDDMIMNEAKAQFTQDGNGHFSPSYFACWEELKDSPLFQAVPVIVGRSSTKRSKTSTSSTPGSEQATSDARFGFDLNDDDLEMQGDEPVRATGRDTAKAKAKKDKAKGKQPSSSRMLEDTEGIATIAQQLTQWNAIAQSRVELKKERQRAQDMKILMKNVDHLEGKDLELVLAEKARIRAKYEN